MIQRYIYTALQTGLSTFAANPDLYNQLFGDLWDLDPTEVATITRYFTAYPPSVAHAYSQREQKFPQYIIVTGGEQQPMFALSDYGGPGAVQTLTDGRTAIAAASYASIWQHNIEVVAQATKVEVAVWMHEIAKAIFVSAKPYFQANHLELVTMAGTEFAPVEGMSESDFVFQRALSFRCQREFRLINAASSLGKVFSVLGVERPTTMSQPGELQLISTTIPSE